MTELHPLATALTAYRDRVAELGFDLSEVLRPGLAVDAVTARLGEAGLRAHPDAVRWFATHDGLRSPVQVNGVFDSLGLASLDASLAEREILRADTDLSAPFERQWLPISTGRPTVVIDCETGQVVELWWDEPARSPAPNLARWVEDHHHRLSDQSLTRTPEWIRSAKLTIEAGTESWPRWLDALVANGVDIYRSVGGLELRIVHAPVGTIAANDALERSQADLVAARFLAAGLAPDTRVELVEEPPELDHVHAISVFCRVPDTGH